MRIKNIYVSNSRLLEGSYHLFRILKTVNPGNDNDTFFVMQDPMGYKVMVPAGYYAHYGFENGQDIECRVDRINCNGRMFLEPRHPVYREGNNYDFVLTGSGRKAGFAGDTDFFITVKDALGQEWHVKTFDEAFEKRPGDIVNCRVERIKKGKLLLSLDAANPVFEGLEMGKFYLFSIVGETINSGDGMRYFTLKDAWKRTHVLVKKFYVHYGLQVGQQIHCRVDTIHEDGYLKLEPENPWYREGERYNFKTIELHKLHFSNGDVQDVLILDDPHGEPVKLFIEQDDVEKVMDKARINCLIRRIRKGRLEPVLI